jgi:hypothetical protein
MKNKIKASLALLFPYLLFADIPPPTDPNIPNMNAENSFRMDSENRQEQLKKEDQSMIEEDQQMIREGYDPNEVLGKPNSTSSIKDTDYPTGKQEELIEGK